MNPRYVSLSVGVVVVGLVGLLALTRPDTSDFYASSLLGKSAPATIGVDLDGERFDLSERRGSWVVLNFFATWCPGCVEEHDNLVTLEQWGSQRGDLGLVSVLFAEPDIEGVREFFAERGGDWPVLESDTIPVEYGIAQIPETFLISPQGQVVWHRLGAVNENDLDAVTKIVSEDSGIDSQSEAGN